ncbi:hypothetical protein JX266_014432 [Neoarthrinium moseri]|nr:hypothetical protein JX266_014432 [Neoarthrinium moseri]
MGRTQKDVAGNVSLEKRSLEEKAIQSSKAVHREGMAYRDVRLANSLLNDEVNQILPLELRRFSLAQFVPDKRRRKSCIRNKPKSRPVHAEIQSRLSLRSVYMIVQILYIRDSLQERTIPVLFRRARFCR